MERFGAFISNSVLVLFLAIGVFLPTPAAADGRQAGEEVSVSSAFRCEIDGAILRLSFPTPHGKELAVQRKSDGMFFFVVFVPREGMPEGRISDFESMTGISVPVATFEGLRYEAGNERWEPVFNGPGKYEFRMADNLQTDFVNPDEIGLSTCIITIPEIGK